jgi:hypothetical protein
MIEDDRKTEPFCGRRQNGRRQDHEPQKTLKIRAKITRKIGKIRAKNPLEFRVNSLKNPRGRRESDMLKNVVLHSF